MVFREKTAWNKIYHLVNEEYHAITTITTTQFEVQMKSCKRKGSPGAIDRRTAALLIKLYREHLKN